MNNPWVTIAAISFSFALSTPYWEAATAKPAKATLVSFSKGQNANQINVFAIASNYAIASTSDAQIG